MSARWRRHLLALGRRARRARVELLALLHVGTRSGPSRRVRTKLWLVRAALEACMLSLTTDSADRHGHVCLRRIFANVVFECLLVANAAIRYENVVDLLEVQVNVIVMVRVKATVALCLLARLRLSSSTGWT